MCLQRETAKKKSYFIWVMDFYCYISSRIPILVVYIYTRFKYTFIGAFIYSIFQMLTIKIGRRF